MSGLLGEICKQDQLDILCMLEDTFTLSLNRPLWTTNFGNTKVVMYTPLDGARVPTQSEKILRRCDKIFAMAKFTKQELAKDGFDSILIEHGVDENVFHPVSKDEQNRLKQKYGFKSDDIILYNHSFNRIRKNVSCMLEATAKACLKNPKLKGFFHIINHRDVGTGDVIDFMERILPPRIGGRKLLNKQIFFTDGKGKSDEEVAEYVKMSDVCISSSCGEGELYKDSEILTTNGYIPIQNIIEKDLHCKTINHENKTVDIIASAGRELRENEYWIKIKTKGQYMISSNGHKHYVRRDNKNQWMAAEDITPKDFLILPKMDPLFYAKELKQTIKYSDYFSDGYSDIEIESDDF